jgi:GST-like protein
MEAWLDRVGERPAVKIGGEIGREHRSDLTQDREAQKILFGQTARD